MRHRMIKFGIDYTKTLHLQQETAVECSDRSQQNNTMAISGTWVSKVFSSVSA